MFDNTSASIKEDKEINVKKKKNMYIYIAFVHCWYLNPIYYCLNHPCHLSRLSRIDTRQCPLPCYGELLYWYHVHRENTVNLVLISQ